LNLFVFVEHIPRDSFQCKHGLHKKDISDDFV